MSIIINKVTTKTGDKGFTLGPKCKQFLKCADEIEFLGNLDELNATLGILNLYLNKENQILIQKIQNDLFDIGATFFKQKDIDQKYYDYLDKIIKEFQDILPPLSSFLLPRGNKKTVFLHFSRAITRRTERSFYKIKNYIEFQNIGIYLNRLSDVFFILSRDTNQEILWENKSENNQS